VRQISIADNEWVEAELQIYEGALLPERPGAIAASASLFGEWQVQIISLDDPPDDPIVLRELQAAQQAVGDGEWPGATLPDIGQLTAQGARIATDIATVSSRIQTAFDSQTVQDMQRSIHDFGQMADTLTRFGYGRRRAGFDIRSRRAGYRSGAERPGEFPYPGPIGGGESGEFCQCTGGSGFCNDEDAKHDRYAGLARRGFDALQRGDHHSSHVTLAN
jgi:hypothetical protein